MAKLNESKDEYSRWCTLGRAAKESIRVGKDAEAKAFALELEGLAPKYKSDWNYGNAVQDINIVLGRLKLKSGEVEAAKARLLAAGKSPGSPQMNSFGPNMTLAKDLLAKGEQALFFNTLNCAERFGSCRTASWTNGKRTSTTAKFQTSARISITDVGRMVEVEESNGSSSDRKLIHVLHIPPG